MEVLTSDTSAVGDNYVRMRRECFEVESCGYTCIHLVQSLLLLAVYEYGQAVFPNAFITLGRVARLAVVMGLNNENEPIKLFKAPNTWTQCEERRRTWWAILMLDR